MHGPSTYARYALSTFANYKVSTFDFTPTRALFLFAPERGFGYDIDIQLWI